MQQSSYFQRFSAFRGTGNLPRLHARPELGTRSASDTRRPGPAHKLPIEKMRLLLVIVFALLLGGCAHLDKPWLGTSDAITVEGAVSVRGNTPFTALVLETDDRTFYVLSLDAAARADLQPRLPGRYRVTGTLYEADWAGRPTPHLRPASIERMSGE